MRLYIHEKWIDTLALPFGMLLVIPLFNAAGLPSPLNNYGIWGIFIFVFTTWGISNPLSSSIKCLLRLFARKYFRLNDEKSV